MRWIIAIRIYILLLPGNSMFYLGVSLNTPSYNHGNICFSLYQEIQLNCASMDRAHGFNWTSIPCETKADFVCETM
jgi:hypothetical protein